MSPSLSTAPKNRPWSIMGLGIVVLGVVLGIPSCSEKEKPKKPPETTVSIVLPPPLPKIEPPKPKPEPPKPEEVKQEMVKQDKIEEETPPPDAPPPPAAEAPATNLEGPGPDFGMKLGNPGKGLMGDGGNGTIGGTGRRGGGKYDAYAGQVQGALRDALSRDSKTRTATFSGTFRVWVDGTGRVTRAKGPDGNASNALTGLQLPNPPPSDMPMPIVMRISASKPASASR